VIAVPSNKRKHQIAEEYLAEHKPGTGVFLILVSRAPATVWKVDRSAAGVICNLEKTRQFVNHYSFHIIDPTWGHVTIKISGHPPFGAQVMLNGHDYVACAARSAGVGYRGFSITTACRSDSSFAVRTSFAAEGRSASGSNANAALWALIDDYLQQAHQFDAIPMEVSILD
jgi:hypothetical protein